MTGGSTPTLTYPWADMNSPTMQIQGRLDELKASIERHDADGELLEQLVDDAATTIPSWELRRCWSFEAWPARADFDLPADEDGIDLVAEKTDGDLVAIQCKARSTGSVTPTQIQKFAGKANPKIFRERWLVATTELTSGNERALVECDVIWKNALIELRRAADEQPAAEKADPRTAMQDEAVKDCINVLRRPPSELAELWREQGAALEYLPRNVGRAKLVLPCGTGKTRVSMRVVNELCPDGTLAVVLVPSIALIGQVRQAYLEGLRAAGRATTTIAVCSDKTANAVRPSEEEKGSNDITRDTSHTHAVEISCKVASDAESIAEFLSRHAVPDRLSVIFSTYQSAHHVAAALTETERYAQVLVCDEAHRTAQIKQVSNKKLAERVRNFTLCHDQATFPARYRLYQTATPKVYSAENTQVQRLDRTRYAINDMNDHKIFGPTGYRRSYVHAVENDLLTDYKIIAFAVDEKMWIAAERICINVDVKQASQKKKQVQLTVTEAVGWLVYGIVLYGGTPEATDGKPIRTSIAFLNRIARSKEMASWLRSDEGYEEVCEYFKEKGLPEPAQNAAIKHLDANHRAAERLNQLDRLENAEYNAGITNVGIFGEGTDTPSLDAVAILAPRKSPTDVIQIVGRCMRRSPAKTTGYVIVPVPLPRGIDAETSLGMDKLGDEWKPLGQILTALRAHDGRIEDRVQDLMDVYVPPDAPVDVEIAVVINDGAITRTGIWKGPATKRLEEQIESIRAPAWTEKHDDVREYLNSKRGFTWSDQQLAGERVTEKLTDRASGADQETLAKRPHVCVLRRDRGGVKLVDTTPTAHEDPSKTGFDIGGTVRKAQNLAANRAGLRNPRRRRTTTAKPTIDRHHAPKLWEKLESNDPTHSIAVEIMEKSGLKGNDTRDFNLLQEIIHYAAAELDSEVGLEQNLRMHLGMPDEPRNAADSRAASATKVATLLLLNALMLHSRIEGAGGRIAHELRTKLERIAREDDPLSALINSWTTILDHDYKPVFQPARRVATVIRDSEYRTAGWRAVRRLIEWAGENADYYQQMGMEYAGQLFSRVMGHQAADGAYFTRPEAARLLAELALDQMPVKSFSNPQEWLKLKATDLACGSGTLLNAWIESVKDRIRAEGGDENQCATWHKKAVEQLTAGLDINPVSLQMAAGRFILGNLSVDYRKIALYELAHGRTSDGQVRLGTLELLGDDEIVGAAPDTFVWEDDDVVDPDTKAALANTKVVLTNPPFSDRIKRNQNVDDETKHAMQQREVDIRNRLLASDETAGRLIDTKSISTFFTPLIDCVLDRDDGVLAKILPMTACTTVSGRKERQFLASRFWIKYIVMCHDPKNINLSQETDINECLLIGTRRGAGERKPTTFVNLSRYPLNTDDARAIAAALRYGNFDAIGRKTEWPADQVEAGDWSPVQWYAGALATVCNHLRKNGRLATAESLYQFSAQGANVWHCFEPMKDNARTHGQLGILTSIAEKRRSYLVGTADEVWQIMPVEKRDKRGGKDLVPKYIDEQGWMLAAQRFRTTNSRTASQYTAEPALGMAYVAIRTDTPDEAKTLNLLWNSTPVLIQLLGMRTGTAAYIHWSGTQLRGVKLPAEAREPNLVRALAGVHEELADMEIGRLQYAADDPVRATIDDATAELFGLTPDTVAEWRKWLSQEPFMHNTSPVDD